MKPTNTVPNYEECVRYALAMKGIAGNSFKDTDLRVYKRRAYNSILPFTVLDKGGIFIPVVSGSLLGMDHPTAVVAVKTNEFNTELDLYIPQCGVQTFPFSDFIEAWDATGGLCVTAFPADKGTYRPKLMDLSHTVLPDSYTELREAIAQNAHDTWATERQSEGWTYGPKRDDDRLETPDMVPYEQLSESEKQYDRLMAEDTLKLMVALGYRIEKQL